MGQSPEKLPESGSERGAEWKSTERMKTREEFEH
jgi:hypothetical protein